jgi:hypothetical protein
MNPLKYAFGVSIGQFLRFMIHERGIEIGQKSFKAIRDAKAPSDKKELQSLIWVRLISSGGISQICQEEFSHSVLC